MFVTGGAAATEARSDDGLPVEVLREDVPARLVELTAQFRVENTTSTPVDRYVYRITEPAGDLDSQRVTTVSASIAPVSRKTHKTGVNRYLEFEFSVPPGRVAAHNVSFHVLLLPVDYSSSQGLSPRPDTSLQDVSAYLQPSRLIESDSPEVKQAARFAFRKRGTKLSMARKAYEFPARVLTFRLQKENLGAQKALQGRVGDCTEFACLFAALCRTQKIPAKRLAVFNFGMNQEISVAQPNHHVAEVFLKPTGWLPVDANLGAGRYDRPVGFGRLSNMMVAMNREGSWVWSTWLPPDGYSKSLPKPKVKYSIAWEGKVLSEGHAEDLWEKFAAIKSPFSFQ